MRNWNRLKRSSALDRRCDGYIQIVRRARLAVQIGESKIRSEDDAAAAKHVGLAEHVGVFVLAAEVQSVLARRPCEVVLQLIAIHVSALRNVEIHSIGEVRKNQFVSEAQIRIRGRQAVRKFGNHVEESVEVKEQVVYLGGRQRLGPARDHGIETVQRILALGGGKERRNAGGAGRGGVRGTIERIARRKRIGAVELIIEAR